MERKGKKDEVPDAFAHSVLSEVYLSAVYALLSVLPNLFVLCLYGN